MQYTVVAFFLKAKERMMFKNRKGRSLTDDLLIIEETEGDIISEVQAFDVYWHIALQVHSINFRN